MNPLLAAGAFLIQITFSTYILILLVRLLLQFFGANFSNPIAEFILKITQPIIAPLSKILPKPKGIDLGIVVAAFALEVVKVILLTLLQTGSVPGVWGIVFWSIGLLFNQLINIFFFGVVLRVILSWFSLMTNTTAIMHILHVITERLMSFASRYVPIIGGLDLSPIAILIGLQLVKILVATPFIDAGIALAQH